MITTKLLDGSKTSIEIRKNIKKIIKKEFINKKKYLPHLGIILVGNYISSKIYVNNKIKECKNIGMNFTLKHFKSNYSEGDILQEIINMNKNPLIDGFIIQLPLEKHIDKNKIILSINPKKDVDGFHPENFGKMALDMNSFIPATALGIITLLNKYKIKINGKHTVVIGRSKIVGRPISILMSRKNIIGNSTVTIVHSKTKNIEFYTKIADILIVAIGKPQFIKGNMIKNGVIIIDVGINNINYNKILGDVDYKSVIGKASYLTPVPGGIGPMTRIMLLNNTLKAALNRK